MLYLRPYTKKGSYKGTVTFAGDNTYTASSKAITVKI